MPAPFNNVRSKLARAVAAYLISAGAGDATSVRPANTRTPKEFVDGVNTTVKCRFAKPVNNVTGNYKIITHIIIRGRAVDDTEELDELARVAFDERIALTQDALMQSADGGMTLNWLANEISDQGRALATTEVWEDAPAAQHADMADFTCLFATDEGFGDNNPQEQEHIWEEVLVFEFTACGSAVEGYTNL